jgi:hypothetical protein
VKIKLKETQIKKETPIKKEAKVKEIKITPWQTGTIVYRRCLTGRLEWPGGLWKFRSTSIPHPRGRALAL